MKRYLRTPIAVVAVAVALIVAAGFALSANSASAGPPLGAGLARAIEVQEAHTDALMARAGVVGTAVGLTVGGQPATR